MDQEALAGRCGADCGACLCHNETLPAVILSAAGHRAGKMRILLYLNTIAIIWLAGALVQLYEGAPLPGYQPPAPVAEAPAPAEPVIVSEPAAPSLTPEEMAALSLPFPHPLRLAEPLPQEAAPVEAPAAASLVILTEGDYAPFNYRDEAGELRGFDIEIAAALCERLAAECRFETRRWNDLLPSLKRGEGDAVVASMLIPSQGRDSAVGEGVIFSNGYYSTPGRFAARRNNVPPAATPAALAGRRIGVQAGSAHEAFVQMRFPAAELVAFPNPAEAEKALANGEVDLVFADRNALLRWTSAKEGACCRLVGSDYADPAYFGEGAGIVLRAGNEALRDRINEALASLVSDGTYGRISARHFSANIF